MGRVPYREPAPFFCLTTGLTTELPAASSYYWAASSSWASDCTFTAVRSDNPYGPSKEVPLETILASLWGFYLEGSVRRLNIIGANVYDQCHMDYEDNNKPKPKALEGAWKLSIENPLKQACKIEINQYAYTSNETAEKKLNPKDYPLKK